MEPFRYHVFVCTQQKPEGVSSCPKNGSLQVLQALEREIAAHGLDNEVQLTTSGCLGLCDEGPVLILYPQGTWYRRVKEEDVRGIVESHLRSGTAVSRLEWADAQAMKAASIEHRDRYRSMVKTRDVAGILPEELNEMIRGFMTSRTVLTALELDVFTAVASGSSAEQVAEKIHADSRATEMLLNALSSLRLLEKKEETFFNTPDSARFFTEGSPDNARNGLIHTAHLWHRWSTLTDCVRAGTPVGSGEREVSWVPAFIAAMDRNARERTAAVVKAVGNPGIKRMLDLGGGSAAYSIAFLQTISGLKSEILDVAEVVPLAQENIRKAGYAERIIVRAGDMLRDPLGENFDLILMSAICHMFSPEENRRLFERAFGSLAAGGRLVVHDFILEPGKTAPRAAALFSLNMLVGTRAGSSYSEAEYSSWLEDAGFSEVRRVRLPGPSGLMFGTRR